MSPRFALAIVLAGLVAATGAQAFPVTFAFQPILKQPVVAPGAKIGQIDTQPHGEHLRVSTAVGPDAYHGGAALVTCGFCTGLEGGVGQKSN
jgi:hypothetical protein